MSKLLTYTNITSSPCDRYFPSSSRKPKLKIREEIRSEGGRMKKAENLQKMLQATAPLPL
eukprot:scaffold2413_cov139-Skeletonema_menzelii.AAC.4